MPTQCLPGEETSLQKANSAVAVVTQLMNRRDHSIENLKSDQQRRAGNCSAFALQSRWPCLIFETTRLAPSYTAALVFCRFLRTELLVELMLTPLTFTESGWNFVGYILGAPLLSAAESHSSHGTFFFGLKP
jgi:hypothetical protein